MMETKTFSDAQSLLRQIQTELELHEAANSLMLGILGQLIRHPERFKTPPCLKEVRDERVMILAAIMTPPQKLVVYGHQGDQDGGMLLLAEELIREEWSLPGVLGPAAAAEAFARHWAERTGREALLERRQRLYDLRQVISPAPDRGSLRPATDADTERVTRWWIEFYREVFDGADPKEAGQAVSFRIGEGDIYLWEDGQPVSMAMKTRPLRKGISVSLVYTPPELRGRGYASACVGELSRILLEAGWEYCALFTDLANPTSNSIYQRIGYRPVCNYDEYVFARE